LQNASPDPVPPALQSATSGTETAARRKSSSSPTGPSDRLAAVRFGGQRETESGHLGSAVDTSQCHGCGSRVDRVAVTAPEGESGPVLRRIGRCTLCGALRRRHCSSGFAAAPHLIVDQASEEAVPGFAAQVESVDGYLREQVSRDRSFAARCDRSGTARSRLRRPRRWDGRFTGPPVAGRCSGCHRPQPLPHCEDPTARADAVLRRSQRERGAPAVLVALRLRSGAWSCAAWGRSGSASGPIAMPP
jgi:hypothetical protein